MYIASCPYTKIAAEQPNFLKMLEYQGYPRTSATEQDILIIREFLDEDTTIVTTATYIH